MPLGTPNRGANRTGDTAFASLYSARKQLKVSLGRLAEPPGRPERLAEDLQKNSLTSRGCTYRIPLQQPVQ